MSISTHVDFDNVASDHVDFADIDSVSIFFQKTKWKKERAILVRKEEVLRVKEINNYRQSNGKEKAIQ